MQHSGTHNGPAGNTGLYDPAFEHDSCGFGVIANVEGKASAWLVDQAFVTLARMSHRGGIGADGITGDGCGMLLYRPTAWLRALAADAGIAPAPVFASGHVFLDPNDATRAAAAATELERPLVAAGLHVAGWRDVPVDGSACGPLGASGQPRIRQIFVDAPDGMDEAVFERALFRSRRLAEKARADDDRFYVVSLSAATFVAKAMVAPGRLRDAFPDFSHPDLVACAAVFHQRFSTNTLPRWRLAQPFRILAHTGEINTIQGNINWMKSREVKMVSDVFGEHGDDGKPVIQPGGSDSAALDNASELLVRAGRSGPMAKTLLVPEP